MKTSALLIALLVLMGAAAPAAAQDAVQIRGQVVDETTGEPVPTVDLVVRAVNGRYIRSATTDREGRFHFAILHASGIRLFASRIGYEDNSTPILYFDDHGSFEVELRLHPSAVLLAPLEVVARGGRVRSPVLEGYDRRVRNGHGFYITRKEIERRRPSFVSDLLRTVPGVRVQSSGGAGSQRQVFMARAEARNCPVQLFVDGLLVNRRVMTLQGPRGNGMVIDDFATPGSVEGIEIYRGLSTVPPEFLTREADCGVIAIWTRRGG